MDPVTTLKALADDTRYSIVLYLETGPHNVGDIVIHVNKSQPNISIALKQLVLTGIIKSEKDGRKIIYSLVDPKMIAKLHKLLGGDENR